MMRHIRAGRPRGGSKKKSRDCWEPTNGHFCAISPSAGEVLRALVDKHLEQVSHRRAPTDDEVVRLKALYHKRYKGWNVQQFHQFYRDLHLMQFVKSEVRGIAVQSKPSPFSFVPRCHGLRGSRKPVGFVDNLSNRIRGF